MARTEAIQRYSGLAPVTERSGKSSRVHWRYACPKFLRQSFHEYANESIRHSLWAKTYYDQLIEKGKKHPTAIRAVAFKWIRIMFRCWKECMPYDEVRYLKNLQKRGSYLFKPIIPSTHSNHPTNPCITARKSLVRLPQMSWLASFLFIEHFIDLLKHFVVVWFASLDQRGLLKNCASLFRIFPPCSIAS